MSKPLNKRPVIIVVFVIALALGALLLVFSLKSVTPSDPLVGSEQLVLVVARTHSTSYATLHMFNRTGDGSWEFAFTCPAVIGKNGMGWGRGLHSDHDRLTDDPVKKEGDMKSPEGAFPLIHAYGSPPPSMVNIDFPYTQATECDICVDDTSSKYYNEIIDFCEKGLDRNDLPSHETMIRPKDDLYKYVVVVGHNTWSPKPGAGSCIFIHLWRGPNSHTAGCTAMSEENMLTFLGELDASKNPVFVSLARNSYNRLKEVWGLPDINI